MCCDGLERLQGLAIIPYVQPPIVRRGEDVGILSVVLDLRCSGEPISEAQCGLPGSPQVPAVDIAVDSTGGEHIRMVGREVDIGDGPAMAIQGMLDRSRRGVIPEVQVPDQTAVVCCRCHPVVALSERGPLHIDDEPWQAMTAQSPGSTVGRVEIDDGQAFRAISQLVTVSTAHDVLHLRGKRYISARW